MKPARRAIGLLGLTLGLSAGLATGCSTPEKTRRPDPFTHSAEPETRMARWREAVARNPASSEAHLGLAAALLTMPGHEYEALSEYRAAVHFDPTNYLAEQALGLTLARVGAEAEAIIHLENALRMKPDLPEARQELERLQTAEFR